MSSESYIESKNPQEPEPTVELFRKEMIFFRTKFSAKFIVGFTLLCSTFFMIALLTNGASEKKSRDSSN